MENKLVNSWWLISLILSFSLSLSAQMRLYNYVSSPLDRLNNDSLVQFDVDYCEPFDAWKIKRYYTEIPYYLDSSNPISNRIPHCFEVFRDNIHFQLSALEMPIAALRHDPLVYCNNHNAVYQIRKKHWIIPIEKPYFIGRNGKWLIFQNQDFTSVLFNIKSKRKKYKKKCFISDDFDALKVKKDTLFLEEKGVKSNIGLATEKVQVHTGNRHSFFQNGKINQNTSQSFSCFVLGETKLFLRLINGYKLVYSSSQKMSVEHFPTRFHPAYGLERPSDNMPLLLSGGCMILKEQGKLGMIDTNGVVRMPFVLDSIEGDFQNDLLAVQISGKWGYINSKGQTVITPQYDEARPFYDKLTAIRLGNKWGYINAEGVLIIPCQYTAANPFMFGKATVSKVINGDRYIIDMSNNIIPQNLENYYKDKD